MDRKYFSRLIGIIYVVGALFGLFISLGGLIGLWSAKPQVSDSVTSTVSLVGRALKATNETVLVFTRSLDQATNNLDLIHTLLVDTASSMKQSQGLIIDTGRMMGVDMVTIVHQTQTSLNSTGSNLKVVDDTLRLISGIPFIGAQYKPDVPLQESFGNVSKSLDPLPAKFQEIRRKLNGSASNIGIMQVEINTIAAQIVEIQSSITQAKSVAAKYIDIFTDLQQRFDRFEKAIPLVLNRIYLILTLLLIWIFITNVAMLLNGIQIMG